MTEREQEERRQQLTLAFIFSGIIFLVLLAVLLFSGYIMLLLVRAGLVNYVRPDPSRGYTLITWMVVISSALGAVFAFLFGQLMMRPFNTLIGGMNRLASGKFATRIRFGVPLCKLTMARDLTDSFNTMAEELESTEMLRSDFVNNFSHEFKTPIVSIAGFAGLLRRGDLSDKEKEEYLGIIEDESLRLAAMATNILNLTKVENQNILSDVTAFNLSEQLRSCILQLEEKWTRKNLELSLEFDEYSVEGNEELLRQVWLNLLDNAVKFSPEGETVAVDIRTETDTLRVAISNAGPAIPAEKLPHIWAKFYQADESHAGQGNGIGLAIVRQVVELHGGSVEVTSGSDCTTFTVTLPQKQ